MCHLFQGDLTGVLFGILKWDPVEKKYKPVPPQNNQGGTREVAGGVEGKSPEEVRAIERELQEMYDRACAPGRCADF